MTLTVELKPTRLTAQISPQTATVTIEKQIVKEYIDADYYDGPYEVTPKAETAQKLYTMGKTMTDDVTVVKIPYFETSNLYGDTVYIASEV